MLYIGVTCQTANMVALVRLRLSWTVLPSLISRAKAGDFHWFCGDVMGVFFYSTLLVAMMIVKWVLQIDILFWELYSCNISRVDC